MATTIKQTEGVPEEYPEVPAGLSTAAAAITDAVWQRLEAYVAYRWTPRSIEWVVEGCGEWVPPLTPATIATVEIWTGSEWTTAPVNPSPVGGYCLPGGTYRFTGTVGEDDAEVPAAVSEAFRRLAEYMAGKPGKPGAKSERISSGSISLSTSRSPAWMAEAMANSGAGDLLRPYRRA